MGVGILILRTVISIITAISNKRERGYKLIEKAKLRNLRSYLLNVSKERFRGRMVLKISYKKIDSKRYGNRISHFKSCRKRLSGKGALERVKGF